MSIRFFLAFFLTISVLGYGQGFFVKVNDAFTARTISDVIVVLHGYGKEDIPLIYDVTRQEYLIDSIPKDCQKVVAKKQGYSTNGETIKTLKFWPYSINLTPCENDYFLQSDTVHKFHKDHKVILRDRFKIFVSIKDSDSLTFIQAKHKIDSILKPYPLEFIYDLEPESFFVRTKTGDQLIPYHLFKKIDAEKTAYYNLRADAVLEKRYNSGRLEVEFQYMLAYRLKNHSAFSSFDDKLLDHIVLKQAGITLRSLNYIEKEIFEERELDFAFDCHVLTKYSEELTNDHFYKIQNVDKTRFLRLECFYYLQSLEANGALREPTQKSLQQQEFKGNNASPCRNYLFVDY